jgi:hypothetical protein
MNETITASHLAIFADHLARCLRAYASIQGMKAFNDERQAHGMAIGYPEHCFTEAITNEGLDEKAFQERFKYFY